MLNPPVYMVKFKNFSRVFIVFQGKFNVQGLFKTVLYIQLLFKPVQTLITINGLPTGLFWHVFFIVCRFFSNKLFFLNSFRSTVSECHTVWTQIRPDILSGLIWVQTVCKQTTLHVVGKKLISKVPCVI